MVLRLELLRELVYCYEVWDSTRQIAYDVGHALALAVVPGSQALFDF